MSDTEKVIEGLMCCQYSSKSHCDGCPYCYEGLCEANDCTADLASDALALLKEQGQTINELEEKLRLLEYSDQDILQSGMMPAT